MRMTTIQVYSKKCSSEGESCPKATKVGGNAKLSPPWYGYYRQVYSLFSGDKELKISDLEEVSETEYSFTIESANKDKLDAIEKLIGRSKAIGNITVTIEYKTEEPVDGDWGKIIETAFEGNPLFKEVIVEKDPILHVAFYYAIFAREIVSFWNDNLADYSGNEHYIPAELAHQLITAKTAVNFCTEKEETK